MVVGFFASSVFAERLYPTGAANDTTEQHTPVNIAGAGIFPSQITVTSPTIIAQVRVQVSIAIPAEGDLDIQLISPNSTVVDLSHFRGIGADFLGTIFSDSAAVSITTVASPGTANYRPEVATPLSAFNGLTAVGTWTLNVICAGQTGTINWWSIEFVSGVILPVEMTSFTASGGNNRVLLNWRTESETNNGHFNLYRSLNRTDDGTLVAQIAGHGFSATPYNYSFVDTHVLNGITYYYRISDVDLSGIENLLPMTVDATPSAGPVLPIQPILSQNYPNPFNPSTEIAYNILNDGNVKLVVYDALGKTVATLVNGYQTANQYSVTFDASHLPTGIYFYSLTVKGVETTKLMTLMK